MKLGISTLACHGWSLERSIDQCRQNGIGALEIRMDLHDWSRLALSDSTYADIWQRIHQGGLCVSDLGTGIAVREDNAAALAELERCAQIARQLHCRGLRIMLGSFYTRHSEPRQPLDRDGILHWLQKADGIMEQYGTQVWIETHNEFATGQALRALMEDLPTKHVRLLWDIMHPLEAGESFEKTLSLLGRDLVHVHIKDGTPWPDPVMESFRYTPIGQGTVDIPSAVRLLQQSGYDGWYSLEWEGVWRKELQTPHCRAEDAIADFARLMGTLG